MNEILTKQISYDYCCTVDEAVGTKNVFNVYYPHDGRRKFENDTDLFIKVASFGGKLLFAGREDIIKIMKEKCFDSSAEWFMDADNIISFDKFISKFGYQVKMAHPFYISEEKTDIDTSGLQIEWYDEKSIMQFENDDRFGEAFAFRPESPDVLGVSISENGRIVAMAGASADSPLLFQIGINVEQGFEGKGLGTAAVTLLKNKILALGRLPYYGTSLSHIASQRVALKSGFVPTWAELVTEKIK